MKIYDCDAALGRGSVALPREIETAEDALAEMDHCGIAEALVWHRDMWERDFDSGNQRLLGLVDHPRLHPTWSCVPTCCEEMSAAENFAGRMRDAGACGVRLFPLKHCWQIDPLSCCDLFESFVAHHLPVFLPLPEVAGQWQGVYAILHDFPKLTLVLTQTGCWGQDRFFRPLMSAYEGFFLTMDRFETAGGLKSLVDSVGAEHLLFGSGLPRNYPGGYVLGLMRAEIGDRERAAIAHGNIERLLEEVTW